MICCMQLHTPHLTSTAPSPLLVGATLCHVPGTQASQLHPPLLTELPLLPFLSSTVTTSLYWWSLTSVVDNI
jgi:hypothetical protein